jgi:hypothetical protein
MPRVSSLSVSTRSAGAVSVATGIDRVGHRDRVGQVEAGELGVGGQNSATTGADVDAELAERRATERSSAASAGSTTA